MTMSGEKRSGSMDVTGGFGSAVAQQGSQQVSEEGAVESESDSSALVTDFCSSDKSSASCESRGNNVESRERGETLLLSSWAASLGCIGVMLAQESGSV